MTGQRACDGELDASGAAQAGARPTAQAGRAANGPASRQRPRRGDRVRGEEAGPQARLTGGPGGKQLHVAQRGAQAA